jgi:hypothetical protein
MRHDGNPERLAGRLLVGLALAILPWLFYAPMVIYGVYYWESQRWDALQHLLCGMTASILMLGSMALLRTEGRP